MEWTTVGTALGALVGAAASAYGAARYQVRAQLKAPAQSVEALTVRVAALEKSRDEAIEELKRHRDQLAHCVTDEEFAAYTQHTTEAINKLTGKVGHAAGAIEAWYQTRATRSQ